MTSHVVRFSSRALAVGALFLGLGGTPAFAAPGDVDTSLGVFGVDGKIQGIGFVVNAMVIDAQGRLILVGGQNGEFHVQRRSGSRFLTVEDQPIIFGEELSSANAVALAPDGKIVVAGDVKIAATGNFDFAVARMNPDLTLDSAFSSDGLQTIDVDGPSDFAHAVAVQSDNKIVVAGRLTNDDTSGDWAVVRFEEDGDPDPTFDGNGKRRLGYDHILDEANAVTIQGDKIVMAGTIDDDFGLVRLNVSDGSFDDTFGSFGDTITGFGAIERGRAMAIAPGGKIVVAGTGENALHVARYSADGFPDDTFGDEGKVTKTGDIQAHAVVVQPDGKIVVVGQRRTNLNPIELEFLLLRYDSSGDLDPTFGEGGEVTTRIGSLAYALAAALQPDGNVVAAGQGGVARYRWDGSLDTGGIATITFDPAHGGSEVTSLAVGDNGKLVAVGKVFVGDYAAAVARFATSYGQGLDTSFGNETTKRGLSLFGNAGVSEELRSAAVESDGDVIAAGQIGSQNQGNNFLIARVKDDGTPDPSCSADGLATFDFDSSEDVAAAVAPFSGNRIAAAGIGHSNTTGDDYAFARFAEGCVIDTFGTGSRDDAVAILADLGGGEGAAGLVIQSSTNAPVLAGSVGGDIVLIRIVIASFPESGLELDTSFGVNGKATLDTGATESAVGLAEQSDGSLIVAGTVTGPGDSDFLVARFSADGDLDTSFGVDGTARASFNTSDIALALAVRDDDTIAVAGTTNTADGNQFAVAQFVPDGFLDPDFADLAGKTTLRLGPGGDDVAQAVTFVGANRLVLGGYSTVFGIRQFALAALQTTSAGGVTTTTTTTTTTPLPVACGDPVGASITADVALAPGLDAQVTSSDALFILRTAVGSETCLLCVCDVDDSGTIAASDALLTLKAAVGQQVTLTCPACDN